MKRLFSKIFGESNTNSPSGLSERGPETPCTQNHTAGGPNQQISNISFDSLPALAAWLEVPYLERLKDRTASSSFLEVIPISFARQHAILGLESCHDAMEIAIGKIEAWPAFDVVSRLLKRPIVPIFCSVEEIQIAINRAYQDRRTETQSMIASLEDQPLLIDVKSSETREDLLDVSGRAPVIQVVNSVLFEAVKALASDVHIQPYENSVVVRLRIDGILHDAFSLPKDRQEEIISRVKVIGRMNIAEKRLPQDGRATVRVGDRMIDLRISAIPTSVGERIVIRLLDKSARIYTLEELGMEHRTLTQFKELIGLEHGLILVTGPTGAGKSTTLYAALQEINATTRNIVTLEDPIEYQLEGISQTQVSDRKGMTFDSGLRSVLRQDPDIIMVGEIRDRETAVMAIQSALTGHLVFSTLHTNDAASAITRLLDLGIEHYLVASSLVCVLAQRLVRKICPSCCAARPAAADELRRLEIDEEAFVYRGTGCGECRQTGYRGRVGIFELLVIDDSIRREIQAHANAAQIRDVAVASGMCLLRQDGVRKIKMRVTTVEDVMRVTMRTAL